MIARILTISSAMLTLTALTPAPAPTHTPAPAASRAAAPAPTLAPKGSGSGAGFSFSDWHVSTGQLDANWQSGVFSTPGHITLTRPGSDISADRSNGNFKSHQATLTGHVVLHDNNGVLTNFAGQPPSAPHVPAMLTCDNLNIDGKSKTYIATGNVHFTQGPSEVRANRAVMDGISHDIHLYGNVQLTQ
jgi:lipopolysaccharide assembly outer membrane protein LptD (OstA)